MYVAESLREISPRVWEMKCTHCSALFVVPEAMKVYECQGCRNLLVVDRSLHLRDGVL